MLKIILEKGIWGFGHIITPRFATGNYTIFE